MKNPKSIAITGASSGIGAALAQHYAKPDTTLFLTGRDQSRLEQIAANCRNTSSQVYTQSLDVTNSMGVRQWLEHADQLHPLDLVIANAGVSNAGKEGDEQRDRLIFDTNINGVINTIYPALKLMNARGQGQIAIMSSLAGFYGMPNATAYSTSKVAVKALGEAWRIQHSQNGIEINVVCPGFVKSALTDKNPFKMPFIMPAEKAAKIIASRLAKNQAVISFPWQMAWLVKSLIYLPGALRNLILAKFL